MKPKQERVSVPQAQWHKRHCRKAIDDEDDEGKAKKKISGTLMRKFN